MWKPGKVILVKDEDPEVVWHQRLLCGLTRAASWLVSTPDQDCYPEEVHLGNALIRYVQTYLPVVALPPGVPVGQVYFLGQGTELEFWQMMFVGAQQCGLERLLAGSNQLVPDIPITLAGGSPVGFLQDFLLGTIALP